MNLYPYSYPRVKFHTHTLTHRVGYPHPRVKLPSLVGAKYLETCAHQSIFIGALHRRIMLKSTPRPCNIIAVFVWLWLMAGADLLWENNTADWLVAGGWCWFSMKEQYCWLVGWQAKRTQRMPRKKLLRTCNSSKTSAASQSHTKVCD